MLAGLLMIAQAASATPALDRYVERTRAEIPCAISDDPAEISVCGLREADRYRVTFLAPAESDRDRPHDYTARLLDGRTHVCGVTSRILTGCGMVGVRTRVGFDGTVTRERPLAP